MASSEEFLTYVLDLTGLVGDVTYKKMMGEYLLYYKGKLFGGVYDDRFLVEIIPPLEQFGLYEDIPYSGAKPMYLVDTDDPHTVKDILDAFDKWWSRFKK